MTTDTSLETSTESPRLSVVEMSLAAGWLLLPAVQYAGSYVRTKAVVGREAPNGALARLDLTPWYILLLGLTLVYATFKIVGGRSSSKPGDGPW